MEVHPTLLSPAARPSDGTYRHSAAPLPAGAEEALRPDHPKLQELRRAYDAFGGPASNPALWTEAHVTAEDLRYFRGDNAYVWQLKGSNMKSPGYALATCYAHFIDTLGLLDKLGDDPLFGAFTFDVAGRTVSRDLLDSILEIHFLERHLGISKLDQPVVLDIGAGYGRLAHRMTSALPNLGKYLCTDAVPVSTFLCDYYLSYRQARNARVVPLPQIEETLASESIDLAVNIHSFSECTIEAIDWWLQRLAKAKVRHLMLVPNARGHGGRVLDAADGTDYAPILEKLGYRHVVTEPKYLEQTAQQLALNPTHYHLYRLA
ncbi:MAG: putative sugar O-methyltransferase [Alphaproteobacteria bacterium]|nr:putative sugar O-methyltransferase [Alphaproteobacteria bacterium]MCB9695774.1 putative sugar O-methyltransferase [Alphaproteobacteria bacterium]